MDARQTLDREFLEIRSRLLAVAASFDRISRAAGDVANDPKMRLFQQALEILESDAENRAEQLQLLFSREYDPDWKTKFDIASRVMQG